MKKIHSLCILMAAVLLASCSPTLFFPDRVNTPGFTEAGQVYVTGSIKPQLGSITDSLDRKKGSGSSGSVDAGFAVSDHFAVIGSYRALNNRRVKEDGILDGIGGNFNGDRYEIGLGYFGGERNGFMYEALGGIGFGKIDRSSSTTPMQNFKSRYNVYFAQAGFGGNWDFFRINAGLRLAAHDFTGFSSADPSLRYDIAASSRHRRDVTRQLFLFGTPYIDMEVGYKFLFLNIQQGMPFQLSGGLVSGSPYYMTIGLSVRLGPGTWNDHSTNKTIHE